MEPKKARDGLRRTGPTPLTPGPMSEPYALIWSHSKDSSFSVRSAYLSHF